jgi:guanylate kinase
MPRLFIVAGASGAGKSFLLETIAKLRRDMVPVKKLTTRGPRHYEQSHLHAAVDLQFNCKETDIRKSEYYYVYGKHWYGIKKKEITKLLRNGKNPIVIVRDADTIRRLREDFANSVVLYLQSGLSGQDLANKLKELGRPDLDIATRMDRTFEDFHSYVSILQWNLVDHVVINYYNPNTLTEQIQAILRMEFEDQPIQQDFVFVLMAFDPAMDEIYEAFQNAGRLVPGVSLRVQRVDDSDKLDYRITDEILQSISRAELIVCDLSYERPNVYYELGYARGLGKTVISCAKKGTTLHFDIKDFNTILYDGPLEIQRRLASILERHYSGR